MENKKIDYIELSAPGPAVLKKTTEFYHKVFDWKYKFWGEDYADTPDSGINSGINATLGQRQNIPLVVLYTEDLEATKAEIEAAGAKIAIDIFSFPGGRRFHFTDPAGTELAVWSEK